MVTLSDKLKSMGVKIGAQDIQPLRKRPHYPIEEVLEGHFIETLYGPSFRVVTFYPNSHIHGNGTLYFIQPSAVISNWIKEPSLHEIEPTNFVFLDTETSGLAGGTGTYVFLVGIGRYEEDGFRLIQHFMRDPIEEPAHLASLLTLLDGCQSLVTFNGKAFDVPLLQTRFISNGESFPFQSTIHLDLLPLARRLWKDRLPSRALGYLEEQILEVARTQDDVPGWLIPNLYFDYLRTGDARPLKNVFYHNAMDILSMAALLIHISRLLEDPRIETVGHALDLFSIGKLFEDIGNFDVAAHCYEDGLACEIPDLARSEVLQRWSMMEKRRQNLEAAIQIWQEAANRQEIFAYIELAKIFEHRVKDYSQALTFTATAIDIVRSSTLPLYERSRLIAELDHRLARLQRKQHGGEIYRPGLS
jgi:uncharacterized protein YprB with RNaseH-like and TPR domain